MDKGVFANLYAKLNPEQKAAVDAIEGPVMVVAGPGTGKTQILTLRIANILRQTDTRPEQILAITFTESGAAEMRKRLSEIIKGSAYRIAIHTFHGFCNTIIKNYPEEFPRIIGSRQITEIDQITIIEKLVERGRLALLRPFGSRFLYVRDILSAINELKRQGVAPAEFKKIVEDEEKYFQQIPDLYHEKGAHKGKMKGEYQKLEKKIKKNKELSLLYVDYEAMLNEEKIYDYNDMIMEVLKTLRTNESLLTGLQEEYQYVLVDEHQDTNNAQNKIIELLMNYHENPNIFVVGDERQAIFRFQGASLENFLFFKDLYAGARLITLSENYRSSQTILDSACELVGAVESERLRACAGYPEKPIRLAIFGSDEVEDFFIAADIRAKAADAEALEKIAVLYRDNRDAWAIARMLSKFDIPYAIESDQDLFSDIDVRKIITVLRAVNNYGEDEYLAEALHLDFFLLPPLEIFKVIRESKDKKITLYDLIAKSPIFQDLSKKLAAWARLAKNENLIKVFETIFEESGMLRSILSGGGVIDRFETINAFFDEVKGLVEANPGASLRDLFAYLETIEKHELFIKKRRGTARAGLVRLMTVHRSKGLEFNHVYIARAYHGHFGGRRVLDRLSLLPQVYFLTKEKRANPIAEEDDERRLFYVALTRARKTVTITCAKQSAAGREQLPSQFIGEIKKPLLEEIETTSFEKDFEAKKPFLFQTIKKTSMEKVDTEFVQSIFDRQGLSVTALNNYLECPWNFFYSNLLRLPKAKSIHATYGTAVHLALRDFFAKLKDMELPEKNLLESFEFYLRRAPLLEGDFIEILEKGKHALAGYYQKYYRTWERNVLSEFEIKGIFLDVGVWLQGKLDKLEFIGSGNEVNVVDYKTGKPKSRNEIEGKTANGGGNYKRQLVFYKLILDHYDGGRYRFVSGELDFIEPNDRGEYKKEKFFVSDEEKKELVEIIKKTAEEIRTLSFWDKTCGRKECQYCRLRELMQQ